MQNHLPLTADSPADQQQQQRWEQQQQQQEEQTHSASTTSSSKAGGGQARGLAPEGDAAAVGSVGPAGRASGALGGFNRTESLVDHLAADENLILADEQQGAGSSEAAAGSRSQQPPRAHSLDHDRALEQVRAAEACNTTGAVFHWVTHGIIHMVCVPHVVGCLRCRPCFHNPVRDTAIVDAEH